MLEKHDEIVIDTNVFMHSSNDTCSYQSSAAEIMKFMRESYTKLCVDDEYSEIEGQNTSWICSEYNRILVPGSDGHNTLLSIIFSNRIKTYYKKYLNVQKHKITRLIRNKTDVVFLCIATASSCKTLISNDFKDMTVEKRSKIHKLFDLDIITSSQTVRECKKNCVNGFRSDIEFQPSFKHNRKLRNCNYSIA